MRPRIHTLMVILFLFCIAGTVIEVRSGPGDLDPEFGPSRLGPGVLQFPLTANFKPCCLAQQPDGKLLVLGSSHTGTLLLRRHLISDGSLDTSFGLGGQAVATRSLPNEFVYGNASDSEVQPDGKILVSGRQAWTGYPVVWRFTELGELDNEFGDEGKLVFSGGSGSVYQVALLPNGKLMIIVSYSGGQSSLSRRFSNGSPDPTFGFMGFILLNSGLSVRSLVIEPNSGANYIAGIEYPLGEAVVYRYQSNGTPDTSFSGDGKIQVPAPNCALHGVNAFTDLEIQPDGRVLAAGEVFNLGGAILLAPHLRRFQSNGVTDRGFNGGVSPLCLELSIYLPFHEHQGNTFRIALQSDGKIITLAYDSAAPKLKRVNANGSDDLSFGPSYTSGGNAFDVLVQNGDGKIVVLALPPGLPNSKTYRLIRYLP